MPRRTAIESVRRNPQGAVRPWLRPRLVLLQYPDHLLLAESAPAHVPSPLWANTNPQVRTIKENRSRLPARRHYVPIHLHLGSEILFARVTPRQDLRADRAPRCHPPASAAPTRHRTTGPCVTPQPLGDPPGVFQRDEEPEASRRRGRGRAVPRVSAPLPFLPYGGRMGTSRLRQEPDHAAGRDRESAPRRGRGEARRSGRSPRRSRR